MSYGKNRRVMTIGVKKGHLNGLGEDPLYGHFALNTIGILMNVGRPLIGTSAHRLTIRGTNIFMTSCKRGTTRSFTLRGAPHLL